MKNNAKKFKFLEHTADVKFQAIGKTLEEAFENCSLALKETITKKDKIKIKDRIKKEIFIEGRDFENLLYNFLEQILYLMDAEDFLTSKIKKLNIDKKKLKLEAVLVGDDFSKYKLSNDVKAVTYNKMFVKKIKSQWVCQVVLDV